VAAAQGMQWEMGRLPPEADQVWLLGELARLVAAGGDRQLVRAPIRRATEQDFPDPWTGDLASMERLCRRMLRYAGIGKLEVRLQSSAKVDGPVAFAGIAEGAARFVCSEQQVAEGGGELLGATAREVARAWRAVHGLGLQPPEREQLITEITAVYLGFGVLALEHPPPGGGVAAEHVAFGLAAQILARRTSCLDTWRLLRQLGPRARGDARAALRRLRPAEEVRQGLGLALLEDPPAIDFLRADDRPPVD
jgi:hypothetical protein